MRATLATAIDRLGTAVEWLVVLLTGLLVIIVAANVFMRYVLEVGLLWAEEVSRLTFVWLVFLGAFLALRRRAHLALTFVYDRFPTKVQTFVGYAGALLVLAFLGVLAFYGFELVQQTVRFGRTTPILGISAAWGYLSVPVSAVLMFLEVVRQLLASEVRPRAEWKAEGRADGKPDDAPAGAGNAPRDPKEAPPMIPRSDAVGARAPRPR